MPPIARFLLRRLASIPVSLVIITLLLYGIMTLMPPEERAALYLPSRVPADQINATIQRIIATKHFDAPFPIQYGMWISALLRGQWGFSLAMHDDVLAALLRRTPVTAELTLLSLIVFIPLGLISGAAAGWRKDGKFDLSFRYTAFAATTLPPFILGILLMAVFYVQLGWFPPERLGYQAAQAILAPDYRPYTGLIVLDSFLNGRLDITRDALRHLVLPVISLSLLHFATLGQVTRRAMIEESQKDYIVSARARGLPERKMLWGHAFRNVLAPALTSSALSAASLFTGVIVIEKTFNLKGVSEMILSIKDIPDVPAVLGFSIYSVSVVLLLMLILDIFQAVFDPRVRENILNH